ncbi:MAG: hypothetical protein K8H88_34560, partial [Sandaracinaceae bacterium]|nr:hypothetical protein [Sandaracinaceae bacterium]
MATQTVSHLLGSLQHDPDDEEVLGRLAELAQDSLAGDDAALLDRARQAHDARAEYRAVAQILELQARLAEGDPDRAAELYKELGRVCREELLDDERARQAFARAVELRPGDDDAQDALQSIDQTAAKWSDIVQRFLEEANTASDASLKSSLLVSAASLVWKYKKKGRDKQVDALFKDALAAGRGDARAARLYEQVLRRRNRWEDLAQVLLDAAEHAKSREEKVPLYLRAARVLSRRLGDKARAASCHERVLDFAPGHAEAMSYLAAHFTDSEQWDHLVALYEDALRSRTKLEDEAGVLLQLGMVHWRFRNAPAEAEPFFARLRKLDPAHPGMLDFYREQLGSDPRWITILTDAQRVASSEAQKRDLAIELARVAEQAPGGTDKAIDAWKAVLRLDPTHDAAPEALKALYEKNEKWNALVELLKSEADAVDEAHPERKAALLRHLVPIYRDKLGLDVMVINTYNAILQLVPGDQEALGALARAYESTGRWNDLIQVLTRRAEAAEDPAEKVELYLRVATLWVERFANYNQATAPLERIVEIDPEHREALAQLKEIYRKKRAWSHLYDVLLREARLLSDPDVRLAQKVELAKLAGERLHRHGDAIAMWKEVLEESAGHKEAVDALEKLAEREKDWPTLAQVLERRVAAADDKEKAKILQKLGVIYGEQMGEPAAAASAWKRILELDPKNGRALRTLRETFLASQDWAGLEALYAEQNDYEGLVEVLGGAAERTDDVATRVQLSLRAAELYEQQLGAPHRAFRSYERVLVVDPKNERAARALLPIYERDEKWSRLPALLEIILEALGTDESSTQERLRVLDRLRRLAVDRLNDPEAAFRHAARAFEIAPTDPQVRSDVEESASRAGRSDALMQLYLARVEDLGDADADERAWLRRRIPVVAADLGETDRAVQQLTALLEADPSDDDAGQALEGIYRREARHQELRALLLSRIEHAASEDERRIKLTQLAVLEEDVLEDTTSAASRYRQILEIDPADARSLAALDRLATAGGRWEEMAEVLVRRREATTNAAEARELALRLGEVRVGALGDPEGALEAFASVVRE